MQHKWHKEIKAWADGAEIEQKYNFTQIWNVIPSPDWDSDLCIFRIKPQQQQSSCCKCQQTCSAFKEPAYLYVWLDKENDLPHLEFEKPTGVLEDDLYEYIGKIKLEQDDE